MALKCYDFETKCVMWNIELPHLNCTLCSSFFSMDGYDWYFIVNCTMSGRSIETWIINLHSKNPKVSSKNYTIAPYVEEVYPKYIRIGDNIDCLNVTRNWSAVKGDTLTIVFLITPVSLRVPRENPTPVCLKPPDIDNISAQTLSFESLSKDMVQLFDNKEHSNVVLKCDGNSFPAHKSVLATRSDVFAAMFRHDMRENKSGVVDIVDMNSSLLEQFLRYLYSGKVEKMNIDKAIELYQVADKYAVHSLKQFCASFMRENLSKEVVCNILFLAEQVAESELLEVAESFAAEDEGFLKTDEWRDFALKHTNIGTNVFLKYINKSK